MSGIFVAKPLADGQLPSSKGTLYTVPALTVAYVKQMRIFNTNASSQTVIVFLNVSGTSRRVGQFVLAQNESADVFSDAVQLSAADLVEGQSTNAAAVDYVLYGVEET